MLHARTDLIFPFGGAQFHETFGTGLWHRAIPYEIGGAYMMHWSEKKTKEEKKGIPKRIVDRTEMKGCPTLFRNPSGAPSNVCSYSYRIPYLISDESNSYYHHCHRRGPDHHTGEKNRLIRDPISIRPTVTIFTNSPTFGCGGRSSGMKELHRREQGGNPFNLSLCTATRANSCKERKDTPGIAFSGGVSTGNEITGLPLKLARLANNRAYYVAFVSTALLSPCAAKARLALHVFLSAFAKGIWVRIVPFRTRCSTEIKEESDCEFRRLERVTLSAKGPSTLMASTFREWTSVCRDGSIDKDSDRSNAQYVCLPLCPEIGTSRSG
ncbi:hypothetical protein ALC60_12509 [Trachymyrmex zeteki]|uniref:Uncharacterized protein n=1 Tax=Mycetomoellerius zeteki TaxID=64791 RepID=A0A151WKP3_9HYME|nr:hypothetical protein ALC60_12509 [Trachymyrmex zeteki]